MNSYENIFAILVLIILGYACRRFGFLNGDDVQTLNKIGLYIAIPALIFLAMWRADLSNIPILGTITFVCLIVGVICGTIAYVFAKLRNYSSKTRWSLVTTSAMFNSGFIGFPIVLAIFGGVGLVRAVFFDLGNTILFIAFGILFAIIYGGNYRKIIRRSILFPPFLAVILGILVNLSHFPLGNIVPTVLDYLSGAAIPLIIISLGVSLEFKGVKEYIGAASFVSVVRLVISPLIALLIVSILGWSGLDRTVTIVEAGVPSAMLSLVLAITYDLDIKVSAACIFLTTALSMISITILILLL